MLSWDNFKYTTEEEEKTIPWFPVTLAINQFEGIEQVLECADNMYLNTLNAFVSQAVNYNTYYSPNGTISEDVKVWEKSCKKNPLPLHKEYLGGKLTSFRASPDVEIKLSTKFPDNYYEKSFKDYKGHFWYIVEDGLVKCELYALLSPLTDQSKLGKE